MMIETKISDNHILVNQDLISIITEKLNNVFFKLPEKGRLDMFEARLDILMIDIGIDLKLNVDIQNQNDEIHYIFSDPIIKLTKE